MRPSRSGSSIPSPEAPPPPPTWYNPSFNIWGAEDGGWVSGDNAYDGNTVTPAVESVQNKWCGFGTTDQPGPDANMIQIWPQFGGNMESGTFDLDVYYVDDDDYEPVLRGAPWQPLQWNAYNLTRRDNIYAVRVRCPSIPMTSFLLYEMQLGLQL